MTSDTEKLRRLLEEHREHSRARVAKLEADLAELTRARRSESDDDEHDPEGETLSAQWSMRTGLLESAREDARAIDEAFRRLEEGSYGICEVCGERIPLGQLEVRPFRAACVACTK